MLIRRSMPVLVAALAISGCVPTTWLPDSSGFIYVKTIKGKEAFAPPKGAQLLHFDIQKKATRVVVNDIGLGTMWPAVSPDGKRIAVVRFKEEAGKAKTVKVIFYDFQGKSVKESKEFVWSAAAKDGFDMANPGSGMLFWSPKDDVVVVTDLDKTGVYDLRGDTIKIFGDASPVIHGGTPILPNGTGFLVVISEGMGKDKKARLAVMDWTGKEQKIDTSLLEKVTKKDQDASPADSVAALAIFPLLVPSWWDGNVAFAGLKRDKKTYNIDPAKKTTMVSDGFAALAKADKQPGQSQPLFFDFAGDVSVKVVQFQEEAPGGKGPQSYNKVLVINNKTGKENILEAKAPGSAMFLASPNATLLALSLGNALGMDSNPAQILVINSQGELLSKIVLD